MSNSCPKHLKCLRMLCVSICIWDNGQVRLAWSWRSLEIGYHLKIWCFSIDGVTEQQYEKSEGYGLICWLRYHSSCIFSLIAQILKCFKCTEKSRHSQKKASPNYQESEFQNKKKRIEYPPSIANSPLLASTHLPGVRVVSVAPLGPAEGKIKPGDILVTRHLSAFAQVFTKISRLMGFLTGACISQLEIVVGTFLVA